jgi:hypothetical protein
MGFYSMADHRHARKSRRKPLIPNPKGPVNFKGAQTSSDEESEAEVKEMEAERATTGSVTEQQRQCQGLQEGGTGGEQNNCAATAAGAVESGGWAIGREQNWC